MKSKILVILVLILNYSYVSGQDINFPELSGFKLITKYPVYEPSNLWDFINGAADNYLALGFVDLHVAEYKKGRESIKLEIYRHNSPVMAFGIYASERSPSFSFIELGAQGYRIDGAINFFKGNYYVKIRTYSDREKILSSAGALAERVAMTLEGDNIMPAPLSKFPSEGKQANTEKYVNESILGHGFLNRAFSANYILGPDTFTLYLFTNPSEADNLKMIGSYLKTAGIDPVDNEGKLMINDGYNGIVFAAWKGATSVLITGLAKDQSDIADKYAAEILDK